MNSKFEQGKDETSGGYEQRFELPPSAEGCTSPIEEEPSQKWEIGDAYVVVVSISLSVSLLRHTHSCRLQCSLISFRFDCPWNVCRDTGDEEEETGTPQERKLARAVKNNHVSFLCKCILPGKTNEEKVHFGITKEFIGVSKGGGLGKKKSLLSFVMTPQLDVSSALSSLSACCLGLCLCVRVKFY
jgi:hypothetical protein